MSVKHRDLVRYLEENGFYFLREGSKHSIYTNDKKTIPVKRHRTFDRITANQVCKEAGLMPAF
ncbi:MAG: addiction module toxin, HicA family [Planctomycetes bacterium]|nr:addiction module toxin, HicA family [Planctomycetota bacterium]